jgi:opacity protein-like surface antigen
MALSLAQSASAQARFGTQLNYAADTHFGLGARVGFPLGEELKRKGIEGLVTFDYFFPKGFTYWTATANGLYHFTPANSSVKPYVGGGLSLGHTSIDGVSPGLNADATDVGLNVAAGLRFKAQDRLLPFIEARYELKRAGQFVLAAGVYFGKP